MRGLSYESTRRLTAALLAALALLCLTAPLRAQEGQAQPPLPPPVPGGDALWDRYSASVYLRLTQPEESFPGWHPACLPDAELAGWTDLYDDPRLWELRCWTRVASAGYRALAEEHSDQPRPEGLPDPWSEYFSTLTFFEVAKARGGQSISMALFAQQHRAAIFATRAMVPEGDALDDGWVLPTEQRSNLDLMYTIVENEGSSLSKLCSQYPEHAWPHYTLARHHVRLGEPALAMQELEIGNALPEYELPALFPQSAAEAKVFGATDEGNIAVVAAVLDAAIAVEPPALLHDSFADELIELTLATRDPVMANTLSRFTARVGLSRPGDLNFAAFGLNHGIGLYKRWSEAEEDPKLRSSFEAAVVRRQTEIAAQLGQQLMSGFDYGAVPENRAAWFWVAPYEQSSVYWEMRSSGAQREALADWLARNIISSVEYLQQPALEQPRLFSQQRLYSALLLESFAQAQFEGAFRLQFLLLQDIDYASGAAPEQQAQQ